MNYAKRKDENQNEVVAEILAALPDADCIDLSGAGGGVPDIVIGWNRRNWLFEVKNPNKPRSDQELTEPQKDLHARWKGRGQIAVIKTAAEALAVMLNETRREQQ